MNASVIYQVVNKIILLGLEKFGRYYSSYRGFVTNVNDPQNQNRLRVKCPQVSGENDLGAWAYPKGLYSGKNYGIQNLPAVGDVVYISFEYGNVSFPMWEHGHWGNDEMPNQKSLRNPLNHWFKSPTGHTVEFDDANNIIKITHKDGTYITLSKDNTLINGSLQASSGKEQLLVPVMLMGGPQMDFMKNMVQGMSDTNDMIKDAVAYTSMFVPGPGQGPAITASAAKLSGSISKQAANVAKLSSALSSLPSTKVKGE